MTDPPDTPGLPLGRGLFAAGRRPSPDRMSTTRVTPRTVVPELPPSDALGRPVVLGDLYLDDYPNRFQLVRPGHFTIGNRPEVHAECTWPEAPLVGERDNWLHPGTVRCRSALLGPVDPAVLGREVRALLGFCSEYRESLAPVPDSEEES